MTHQNRVIKHQSGIFKNGLYKGKTITFNKNYKPKKLAHDQQGQLTLNSNKEIWKKIIITGSFKYGKLNGKAIVLIEFQNGYVSLLDGHWKNNKYTHKSVRYFYDEHKRLKYKTVIH